MIFKTAAIVLLIGTISAVHILYHGSQMAFHILHQQLFFIPLILASFWFGMRTGIFLATITSLLFGIPMAFRDQATSSQLIIVTQCCLYFFVAILIGWLTDREKNQRKKLFQNERISALGKAASALSFEVQDIVRQIEAVHRQKREDENDPMNDDILSGVDRLKELLEALAKFSKPFGSLELSNDLNELIKQRLPIYQQNAAPKGVKVNVNLAPGVCPPLVATASLLRVLDSLVDNAIDFSKRGQSIVLRSKREGDSCLLEVADSGPGVSKENQDKLFGVFFTTKPDGYGLSLSSGRKVLRDQGGDLVYRANDGGGAVFTMRIPRVNLNDNIGENSATSLQSQASPSPH